MHLLCEWCTYADACIFDPLSLTLVHVSMMHIYDPRSLIRMMRMHDLEYQTWSRSLTPIYVWWCMYPWRIYMILDLNACVYDAMRRHVHASFMHVHVFDHRPLTLIHASMILVTINSACNTFRMFCPNTNPYRISVLIKCWGQSCLVGGDNNYFCGARCRQV